MTLSETYISLKQALANNLATKGVTGYSSNDGLTTLINGVLNIQTGSGGTCKMVQGTFTTGATRKGTGTVSITYSGSGHPIACLVYIDGGAHNNTSSGNTTWYSSVNRYDVGMYAMTKSEINTTPTYVASASVTANQGVACIIYKNSTSDAETYTRTSSMTSVTYNSGDGAAGHACVRFKGNNKTLSWYVGNKSSSTVGLAPSTKYAYIVIYSS